MWDEEYDAHCLLYPPGRSVPETNITYSPRTKVCTGSIMAM